MKTTECHTHFESLSALLDGELDGPQQTALETHLQGCPSCQQEFQSLKISLEIVESNLPRLPLRGQVWQEIQAEIQADLGRRPAQPASGPPASSRWPFRWIPVTAAAGLGVYLLLVPSLQSPAADPELLQRFNSFIESRKSSSQSGIAESPAWDENPFRETFELDSNPFAVE